MRVPRPPPSATSVSVSLCDFRLLQFGAEGFDFLNVAQVEAVPKPGKDLDAQRQAGNAEIHDAALGKGLSRDAVPGCGKPGDGFKAFDASAFGLFPFGKGAAGELVRDEFHVSSVTRRIPRG